VLIQPYISFFLWGIALRLAVFENKPLPAVVTALVGFCAYALNWRSLTLNGDASVLANLFVLTMITLLVASVLVQTFASPLLALLGRWSYALYLIHENIGLIIIRALKHAGAADIVAQLGAMLACIAGSALLFYIVEQPAERLLRQGFARLQTAAARINLRRRFAPWLEARSRRRAEDVEP